MLYFDAPGVWTSPTTVKPSVLTIYQSATSGGNGGGQFIPSPAAGGLGGQATDTIFLGRTITGLAVTAVNVNADAVSQVNLVAPDFRISADKALTSFEINSLNIGGSGGAGGVMPGQDGQIGYKGGSVRSIESSSVAIGNTVYPITIGQAGAGGGGAGATGGPSWSYGGTGGGPNGGTQGRPGSPASPGFTGSRVGGAGGLVPHSFITLIGNNGANGTPDGVAGVGASGGGGTGVQSYLYMEYND